MVIFESMFMLGYLFSFSNATCEKNCDCSSELMHQPICGSNGITYLSPCTAGCHHLYKNQVSAVC